METIAAMPNSSGGAVDPADAVVLMEKAIDAIFVLKKKVREADERARQQQDEVAVSSANGSTCILAKLASHI